MALAVIRMNRSIPDYIVPLGAAIILTFERGGFLAFSGDYPPPEYVINVFVAVIAPLFAIYRMIRDLNPAQLMRYFVILAFVIWVALRRVAVGSAEIEPGFSAILTSSVGMILGMHIKRADLPYLRRCIWALAAVFTVIVFAFERATILDILGGNVNWRLGAKVSPGVFVAFPRVVYTLVLVCVATFIIEKRIWMRAVSAGLVVVPALLGFAAAGRGGLLGLAAGLLVMALGLPILLGRKRKIMLLFSFVSVVLFAYAGYHVVLESFPVLTQRITEGGDSGRSKLWAEAMEDFSLIGRGGSDEYAHNIFLESLQDCGVVGLFLLLAVFTITFWQLWQAWRQHADLELLWVTSVIALQFTGQQFSLNMFQGFFWSAMMLPLGLNVGEKDPSETARHTAPGSFEGRVTRY